MKKADLKTGMFAETRHGKLGRVLLDTPDGDVIVGVILEKNTYWVPLGDILENLTHYNNSDYDIMRIYSSDYDNLHINIKDFLLWERKKATK